MKCLFPLTALRSIKTNPATGKKPVILSSNPKEGYTDQKLELPCGKCLHCRINRTREWAIRASHEAALHPADQNHFVLLTYDNENLPANGGVNKTHVKKFLDRIRADCAWQGKNSPRTFGCAEYGSKTSRPHYHINIFGLQLDDKIYLKNLKQNKLFTSQYLTKKWQLGAVTLSPFSHLTAQYTAKYIIKALWAADTQVGGNQGEAREQLPPESRCATSTHPGLGAAFLDRYAESIVSLGACEIDGALAPIPSYYKKLLQKNHPNLYKKLLQNNYKHITKLARQEDRTLPTWVSLASNFTRSLVLEEVAKLNQERKRQNED